MGPRAKPSAGSPKAALAIPPAASAPPEKSARRVTVSPSYAPGMPRSAVYFDLGLWGRWEGSEATVTGERRARDSGDAALYRQHRYARHEPECSCGKATLVRQLGAGARPVAREPPDGRGPERLDQLRPALGGRARAQRDEVRQLGHGVEVARLGEPLEAESVEGVAGQQPQVGVHARERARLAVVQQEALVHRLENERVVAVEATGRRVGDGVRPERRVHRAGDLGEGAHATSANASRAASSVRRTCSSPCTSDGNHASYCDGGG